MVIVGAGVAGLACARLLHAAGTGVLLLEASDDVGGRVRTDRHPEGWLLDRGFHIYLDSYPEALRQLSNAALDLRPFYAGALVRTEGDGQPARWQRVADPARHLLDALATLLPSNTVGDVVDKLRVGLLRLASLLTQPYGFLTAPETSSLARLQQWGFSTRMIDTFWRPFLGGIFFDRQLGVSDRLLTFVMRSLATGENCLPAAGIGAVARQLASALPPARVRLNASCSSIARAAPDGPWQLSLSDGSSVSASAVVLAVEGPEAIRLLSSLGEDVSPADALTPRPAVGTVCLYFAAPGGAPSREPILYLNGTGEGLVNNACFPSTVAPSYAPPGLGDLVSASLVGIPPPGSELDPRSEEGGRRLAQAVYSELAQWFGGAQGWRHLATYVVPFAQPGQAPPTVLERSVRLASGLFVCGDHREAATLDGALRSGRRAAEAVLAER